MTRAAASISTATARAKTNLGEDGVSERVLVAHKVAPAELELVMQAVPRLDACLDLLAQRLHAV